MKNISFLLLFLLALCPPALAGEYGQIDLDWADMDDPCEIRGSQDHHMGEVWIEPVTGMEFVWIPGGCFMQGTPPTEPGRYPDEGPVHETCVDGFWMGKYEVTNAQYRVYDPTHDAGDYKGFDLNGDDQPAVYLSWYEIMDFCWWLTKQHHGKYTFFLPTEAEHEYAARGGTTTSRFWGDDPSQACKYANVADLSAKKRYEEWEVHDCDDGYVVNAPVGSFLPNPFGLYDILGNAWEWCQDWNGEYPSGPVTNPLGPGSSEHGRVVRGGSWDNLPSGVRCGNRSYATPNFTRYNNGFRLVRLR
ncbi:MAG: formylglycine-generating enzyme family protein [Deltaproteobacteria bacterium]|nr:formylglycine-generating enzyme family protein [Deltaproteobacteria bacterium]